nr:RNA-directed DNA polymerase, eukaryota, reverse transcriptase zinc-binding domain protein [Tanacetum cinerariifolium]
CRFWEDVWIGSTALKCLFPHVYNLDLDQGCAVADRFSNHGWDPMFRRLPRGGVEASQFNDLQVMLQGSHSRHQTTWGGILSAVSNLKQKGIDLLSLCIRKLGNGKTCRFWEDGKFASWWDLDIPVCANVDDWFGWIDSLHRSSKSKAIIEGAGGTLLWCIWKFRNELLFSRTPPKKSILWDMILYISKPLGVTCRFWEDVWIGSTALKCLFSRVYNLDLDQGCVVADRFSNHDWDPMFRCQPRGDVEASQFNDLQVMLQ